MPQRECRYSLEELSRRGEEIYGRIIRPVLSPEDHGKFVAIDIETEQYAIDSNDYTAGARLIARSPDAQIWLMRIGHATTYRLGGSNHDGGQG